MHLPDKTPEASIPEPSLSSEWKLVFTDSDGTWSTIYVNTGKITYLPNGIVKVWVLGVPRGELRKEIVNFYKKLFLFKGEDPNIAESFWYTIFLYKINCKKRQFARLEYIDYSFGQAVLNDGSLPHEEWEDIPGSVVEIVEKYVCKNYK